MRKQKNNTIEEVTAIIRGSKPKQNRKIRGAMAGLLNQGGVNAVCALRRSGQFCKLIPTVDLPFSSMRGNGNISR
jgi:hypothetical protein